MRKKDMSISTLDFRWANFKLSRELFSRVPWESAFVGLGVHKCWSVFNNCLLEAREQTNPLCRKSHKQGRRAAQLNTELRRKKKWYNLWKQGQASQEDYRALVRTCREKTHKAKVELELKLVSVSSDNKIGFFRYVNRTRKSRENMEPLLIEGGHLINRDEEKGKMLNAFFFRQSLKIDLGLSSPLSQRTMAVVTVAVHLWTLKM